MYRCAMLPMLSDAAALDAQATKMLNEEISSLVGGLRSSSNSSLSAFARMEQKVEALEAEADAAGQMGVSSRCTPSHDSSGVLGPSESGPRNA